MVAQYKAKAAAVKVAVGTSSRNRIAHIVRRGDMIPDGVDESVLSGLVERGLISKVKGSGSGSEVTLPTGDPDDKWTVAQLEKLATDNGFDLAGASTKPEKLAAVTAALAAAGSGS